MKKNNLKKIKINDGLTQYRRRKSSGSGFVILFAVTLSAILLAIALGVANIALKEVKFSTSAKDTNNAFFAADTGIEKALFEDKSSTSPTEEGEIHASFFVANLGSENFSCANVGITKTTTMNADSSLSTVTTIISKGYNIGNESCTSTNPDRVEREIKVSY